MMKKKKKKSIVPSAYGWARNRPRWPPRNRTEQYLFIRQAPSTSWVAASGMQRCRAPAASRPRTGFQGQVPRRRGAFPMRRDRESNPEGVATRRCSGPLPSPVGLPLLVRMAGGSNTRRTRALTSGFRPGTLPLGQPSTAESGEIESHARGHHPASNRSRLLAGSLSLVPPRGLEPRTSTV